MRFSGGASNVSAHISEKNLLNYGKTITYGNLLYTYAQFCTDDDNDKCLCKSKAGIKLQ